MLNLNNILAQVRNRLDKIYDDKLEGEIDEDTYHRKREQLLEEQSLLLNQIKQHAIADKKYVDFGCLVLDVAQRAGEIYTVRKPEEKRYLSNFVFSNLSLVDKNVKFSFNSVFQALHNYQKSGDWLSRLVKNHSTI